MNYKMVYLCSPLRAFENCTIPVNIECAKIYCSRIYRDNPHVLPIAPHLYFSQFMNDEIEQDREAGIVGGNMLLKNCSELWYFSPHGYISEGMKKEIALAKELGLRIKRHICDVDVISSHMPVVAVKVEEGEYE